MDMFARLLPRYLALVLLAVGFLIALHYSGFRQKVSTTSQLPVVPVVHTCVPSNALTGSVVVLAITLE